MAKVERATNIYLDTICCMVCLIQMFAELLSLAFPHLCLGFGSYLLENLGYGKTKTKAMLSFQFECSNCHPLAL